MPPLRCLAPKVPRPRHSPPHANPFYAYETNPNWPSVISVAHDEADGAGLFVITDRPCVLSGTTLPLSVAGQAILSATTVLPIKFRLQMTGAIPRGSAWQWGDGPCQLVGAGVGGGHAPNAGAGYCADVPGPFTPPPPAVVASAFGIGNEAHLYFGQYLLLGGTPIPDGAFTFDGMWPVSVSRPSPYELAFTTSSPVGLGSMWAVNVQPAWLATALEVPQAGTF
jgi:hypothetical protein